MGALAGAYGLWLLHRNEHVLAAHAPTTFTSAPARRPMSRARRR